MQPRNETQSANTSPASSQTNLSIGCVHQMAQSGVGLWVALKNSSTICLYHTETFRHLQDINIASNVSRVLAAREVSQPQRSIHVTALMASRGLLWVGTNVGIALTVPLPRLEGVPIISGRANISYHAHFGAVTFFLNIQHKVITDVSAAHGQPHQTPVQSHTPHHPVLTPSNSASHCAIQEESEHELKSEDSGCPSTSSSSNVSADIFGKKMRKQFSVCGPSEVKGASSRNNGGRATSPVVTRRRSSRETREHVMASRRASKTLPRGFSLNNENNELNSADCDVFGLYGELLNVRDYDCDSGEIVRQGEDLRKSDPELSTIPYRVSTLDRRVRMKTSRPRSLDMSSWSVESRGSAQTTSSSEAGSERPSPSVSRNASLKSQGGVSVNSLNNNSNPHSLPHHSHHSHGGGSGHESLTSSLSSPAAGAASSSASSSESGHSSLPPLSNSHPSTPLKRCSSSSSQQQHAGSPPSGDANSSAVSKARKKLDVPRTVTTLMGGRGYINWRRNAGEKQRAAAMAAVNNFDAFLVIWEMKL